MSEYGKNECFYSPCMMNLNLRTRMTAEKININIFTFSPYVRLHEIIIGKGAPIKF